MKKSGSQKSKSPSQLIDARIKELGDWRGKMLSRLRALVKEADPEVVEEWKWGGVPVWSHDGLICTGETCGAATDNGDSGENEQYQTKCHSQLFHSESLP